MGHGGLKILVVPLLGLIWSLAIAQTMPPSLETDTSILIELRNSIVNWAEFAAGSGITGWDVSTPTCLWYGITCRGDPPRVSSINLTCSNETSCTVRARGTLPSSLSQMDSLEIFSVMLNEFTGQLPESWGSNTSFPSLRLLLIMGNELSGTLPESYGQPGSFPQLQTLRLGNNNLSGPLPVWKPGGFPNLLLFRLLNNSFSGTLPDEWAQSNMFPSLQVLNLNGNQLTGTLPVAYASSEAFPSLEELTLDSNLFDGDLPSEWGTGFSNLSVLRLSSNQFSGVLPEDWGGQPSFPALISLDLENASLTGTLPASWGQGGAFASLETLGLDQNDLSGTIPDEWNDLTALMTVYLVPGNDDMCGTIPFGTYRVCNRTDPSCIGDSALTDLGPCEGSEGGGSGDDFPVAAVAVPVSVVGAALIVFLVWLLVRRRRRSKEGRDAEKETVVVTSSAAQPSHPFDTFEGQERFTSPFADPMVLTSSSSRRTLTPPTREEALQSHNSSLLSSCGARIFTKSLDGEMPVVSTPPLSAEQAVVEMTPRGTVFSSAETMGMSSSGAPSSAGNSAMFSDWELNVDEITIMKRPDGSDWLLGSGAHGLVYKALRNGATPVAVKKLSARSDMHQVAFEQFRREIAILRSCRDTNIVQFIGASLSPGVTMLVTEFMEGGNLTNNIATGKINWWMRGKRVAMDVCKGLIFLHKRHILHGDIKSPNVLLTKDGTAKICDVGMARILAQDYVTGTIGTLAWSAPEMLWGQKCTVAADIYSFAVVLYEIVTGEIPVRGKLRDLDVPKECPEELKNLILECLEMQPARRPTAHELMKRLIQVPDKRPGSLKGKDVK